MSDAVPGWALELLRDARVARLGTADRAARPLVVPICYAFDGRHVYSAIDAKPKRTQALRRVRNITENPAVAVVVDEYGEDWTRLRHVIVQGRADLLTGGGEFARGIDLLRAKYPQYRAMGLSRESGTLIRVAPEHYVCWSSA